MTGDSINRLPDQPGPVSQSKAITCLEQGDLADDTGYMLAASELNILSELAPLMIDTETHVCGLCTLIKVLEVSRNGI